MRAQFIDELKTIRFLPRSYSARDPTFNANGEEENVLKAAITAGMYASVIKVEKTRIKFHRVGFGMVTED